MNVNPTQEGKPVVPPDAEQPVKPGSSEYTRIPIAFGPKFTYVNGYIAVPVKTVSQEIPWMSLVWAIAVVVLEFLLRDVVPFINFPEPVRPFVPMLIVLLGIIIRHAKSKSVPAAALQDPDINVTPIDTATLKEVEK